MPWCHIIPVQWVMCCFASVTRLQDVCTPAWIPDKSAIYRTWVKHITHTVIRSWWQNSDWLLCLWLFCHVWRIKQRIFSSVGTQNNETLWRSLLSLETSGANSVCAAFIEDFKMTNGAFALFWIAPCWACEFTLIIKSFSSYQSHRRYALCGVFKIMTIIKK